MDAPVRPSRALRAWLVAWSVGLMVCALPGITRPWWVNVDPEGVYCMTGLLLTVGQEPMPPGYVFLGHPGGPGYMQNALAALAYGRRQLHMGAASSWADMVAATQGAPAAFVVWCRIVSLAWIPVLVWVLARTAQAYAGHPGAAWFVPPLYAGTGLALAFASVPTTDSMVLVVITAFAWVLIPLTLRRSRRLEIMACALGGGLLTCKFYAAVVLAPLGVLLLVGRGAPRTWRGRFLLLSLGSATILAVFFLGSPHMLWRLGDLWRFFLQTAVQVEHPYTPLQCLRMYTVVYATTVVALPWTIAALYRGLQGPCRLAWGALLACVVLFICAAFQRPAAHYLLPAACLLIPATATGLHMMTISKRASHVVAWVLASSIGLYGVWNHTTYKRALTAKATAIQAMEHEVWHHLRPGERVFVEWWAINEPAARNLTRDFGAAAMATATPFELAYSFLSATGPLDIPQDVRFVAVTLGELEHWGSITSPEARAVVESRFRERWRTPYPLSYGLSSPFDHKALLLLESRTAAPAH